MSGVERATATDGPFDWYGGLILSDKKVPRAVLANALHALRFAPELAGLAAFDTFTQRSVFTRAAPWGGKAGAVWADRDDSLLADWLQHAGIMVGTQVAGTAAQAAAHDHEIDSLQDYLRSLTWDGQPRFARFGSYFGAAEWGGIPNRLAGLWVISAVARAMRPGVKADCVLVLEGPQGARKSTALRVLFDPLERGWFRDELPPLDSKDSALQLCGAWCVEISELDAVNAKRAELERVKGFLSRQIDSYRPPYGRRVQDVPRRCVFAGTTNDAGYLRDSTGNRRWWPLSCGVIDVDGLARDSGQIWAEALNLFDLGVAWWPQDETSEPDIQKEQERRRTADPWEDHVMEWLENPRSTGLAPTSVHVTVANVLQYALKIEPGRKTQSDAIRVVRILQREGYTRRQMRNRHTGAREWIYSLSPETDDDGENGDNTGDV